MWFTTAIGSLNGVKKSGESGVLKPPLEMLTTDFWKPSKWIKLTTLQRYT